MALLIAFTHCANGAPSPDAQRRQMVVYKARAKRRRYPSHGPAEFYGSLA